VLSYPEETDTNFTDADFLERITNFSTGVEEGKAELAAHTYLHISPNPASLMIEIRYMIHDSGSRMQNPTLSIYDANGRLVKSFHPESSIQNQESAISWHGDDNTGRKLPGGMYFLRLGDGKTSVTRKIALIR
jgi:hypothetical protein